MLPGNLEAHVRSVFPLPNRLDIGFTLGVAAPTAMFDRDDRPNRSAAAAVASLDPTNYAHFLPARFAFRPAGDLRIVHGLLVFQGRHGIDVFVDGEGSEGLKTAGRLLGHVGLLARQDLELSIEATQLYFFSSDDKVVGEPSADKAFAEKYRISDSHRTALTIGPGVRFAFSDVDVGASLVTNLNDPFSPAAGGFVALRVSVIGHVGSTGR